MINENTIKSLAEENQVIPLIKEFRAISGFGLGESKNVIESCYLSNEKTEFGNRKLSPIAVRQVFAPYLNYKAPEQLESERLDQIKQERIQKEQIEQTKRQRQISMREKILKGVQIAFDNWDKLGYHSPFDAVRNILSNFDDNWEY